MALVPYVMLPKQQPCGIKNTINIFQPLVLSRLGMFEFSKWLLKGKHFRSLTDTNKTENVDGDTFNLSLNEFNRNYLYRNNAFLN